ncbi:MAG: NADH-quinone oxidoreductase subunit NuoE [Porticoccaceae bacterium]|nr:MAG: NADH-quinone oxidoreductase subunit NuoE [Porticoccaceae bacterium]
MSEHQLIQSDIALSAEEVRQIDAELAHIPQKSGAAIDALKIVQSQRGWVSDEALVAIARYLDMSPEALEGVATFYNLIYRQPVGDKVVLFCDSVSCWICGCDGVKQKISEKLGIDYGETTADNQYTLIPVPCLGACDKAPVMMVGDDLYTNLDDQKIDQIFAKKTGEGEGC